MRKLSSDNWEGLQTSFQFHLYSMRSRFTLILLDHSVKSQSTS